MSIIENEAFEKLKSMTQPNDEWIKQIPKGNVILSPANNEIFTDYSLVLAEANKKNQKGLQDFEIAEILKYHHFTTRPQIIDLINNLEQYTYKINDARAKQFLNDLSNVYPNIPSSYLLNLLPNLKNKPFTIIYAEAGAYGNTLQRIMKQLPK